MNEKEMESRGKGTSAIIPHETTYLIIVGVDYEGLVRVVLPGTY